MTHLVTDLVLLLDLSGRGLRADVRLTSDETRHALMALSRGHALRLSPLVQQGAQGRWSLLTVNPRSRVLAALSMNRRLA